jgi:hypothetical protein
VELHQVYKSHNTPAPTRHPILIQLCLRCCRVSSTPVSDDGITVEAVGQDTEEHNSDVPDDSKLTDTSLEESADVLRWSSVPLWSSHW